MFEINKALFIQDLKIFESFKAKLIDSELWMGGSNARLNSSPVFHSIVAAAGSCS